jgi:IclR family transcriptional regulator, KDG regulon repressor
LNTRTPYKSISNAAKILSCVSDGEDSVTRIARLCGLSIPTVSRLLEALNKSNFVIRDPIHRKYYLGPLLDRLVANPRTTHLNLIMLAMDEMEHLSEISGETVNLGILVGIRHVQLHIVPSRHNVRVYDDENFRLTRLTFKGAATKVLLSQLNRKELNAIMNSIELEKVTHGSIFDKKEYIRQLNQIKRQGYAISRGEIIAGASMISVPVKGYQKPAVLSVVGVDYRLEPRSDKLIPEIMASANRISGILPKTPDT